VSAPAWSPAPNGRRRSLPRQLRLFTPLPFGECATRIGPDSGDEALRWAGSSGTGLAVAWKGADEVELSKSGVRAGRFHRIVRAHLESLPNGTLVDTTDHMRPGPRSFVATGAMVVAFFGFAFYRFFGVSAVWFTVFPSLMFFVGMTGQYVLALRMTTDQHAFVITTLQYMLGATPAGDGADAGVR